MGRERHFAALSLAAIQGDICHQWHGSSRRELHQQHRQDEATHGIYGTVLEMVSYLATVQCQDECVKASVLICYELLCIYSSVILPTFQNMGCIRI